MFFAIAVLLFTVSLYFASFELKRYQFLCLNIIKIKHCLKFFFTKSEHSEKFQPTEVLYSNYEHLEKLGIDANLSANAPSLLFTNIDTLELIV